MSECKAFEETLGDLVGTAVEAPVEAPVYDVRMDPCSPDFDLDSWFEGDREVPAPEPVETLPEWWGAGAESQPVLTPEGEYRAPFLDSIRETVHLRDLLAPYRGALPLSSLMAPYRGGLSLVTRLAPYRGAQL